MTLLSTKELQLSGCTVSCQSDHLLKVCLNNKLCYKEMSLAFYLQALQFGSILFS